MMSSFRLSARLSAIADFIPYGARMADIGTDHGYLPVWSLLNRQSPSVIATDVHENPLRKAICFARTQGVVDAIDFMLCDGLEGVSPELCDTIIIAGMGGENIAGILRRAPWTRCGKHLLILQPMTRDEVLTRWLCENGYMITDGRLARESGRIRQILVAVGGDGLRLTPGQLFSGPWLIKNNDPLLAEYVAELSEKLSRVKNALERSAKESDRLRVNELEIILLDLEQMKKEEKTFKD